MHPWVIDAIENTLEIRLLQQLQKNNFRKRIIEIKDKNNCCNKEEETVFIMSLDAPQSSGIDYWGLVVWFK